MRVLYDHQIFQEQDQGGISRYFTELYAHSAAGEAEIAVIRSDNRHLFSLEEMRARVKPYQGEIDNWLGGLNFRGKRRLYQAIRTLTRKPAIAIENRRHSIARIRSSDWDVFHPTYYDPYFLDNLDNRPFVLTVHDLIHELFPGDYSFEDPTRRHKKILCHKAARIIAVSQTTRKDLVEWYGVDPGKIDVVYHGVSITQAEDSETASPGLPSKYLLFTGTRSGYKNFSFLVSAIAERLRQDEGLHLVCTGRPFTAEERSLFRRLSVADRVLHIHPSDEELAAVYANAEIFVFPSLYEGFGMPILEAFACGCPVVLCDTPPMREVASDAALFFEPGSASGLTTAFARLLDDRALREALVERGRKRSATFSWKTAVAQTREVYRRALEDAKQR